MSSIRESRRWRALAATAGMPHFARYRGARARAADTHKDGRRIAIGTIATTGAKVREVREVRQVRDRYDRYDRTTTATMDKYIINNIKDNIKNNT